MKTKTVLIVGAGPGGLTAGMLLAHKGYQVTILERLEKPGGRNQQIEVGEYRFDLGPTFLMMTEILRGVFKDAGRDIEDYLKLTNLSPMYRLVFDDKEISMFSTPEKTKEQLRSVFGEEVAAGYDRFMVREKQRLEALIPLLQTNNSHLKESIFTKAFLKAIPHFAAGSSLLGTISQYFKDPQAQIAFTFGSKYLGMAPWECPGAFAMIPYIEHSGGVWHVEGGLSAISRAMAKVIEEEGGELKYQSEAEEVVMENGVAKGVRLANGEEVFADAVIMNADFGYAMTHLFPEGAVKKYTRKNLNKRPFSCSTFMLYLGLDKVYDLPHHSIVFAKDYRKNIDDISKHELTREDVSFYIHNPSAIDKTLAPEGHSALYVLVPLTNNRAGINWEAEQETYRELLLKEFSERTGIKDLEDHIVAERVITPDEWEQEFNVYEGAVFNLAHYLSQMLYFRPHNECEEAGNCYLVGGGTHPGSGLPTIYESGRIVANIINKKQPPN